MTQDSDARERNRPGRLAFLATAIVLATGVFGTPFFTGRVYSQADNLFRFSPWAAHQPAGFKGARSTLLNDVPMVFYPALSFARDRIRSGQLPTWNPHVYGGQPFIGATQTAVFSPITAIAWIVPLPDALTFICLARVLLGGLGMFVLLGAWGLRGWSRQFGGLAWMLAPFTVVWLEHPLSEVSAWMPWLVWATTRVCTLRRFLDVAALALITALTVFAGHPETALKGFLLCGVLSPALAVSECATRTKDDESGNPSRMRLASLGIVCAVAGLFAGVALAAVQVLPTLEYLRESRTFSARRTAAANIFVMAPETAATLVVPNFLGHPVGNTYLPMENRYGLISNYAEQQAYPGVPVWLLAAVGTWRRRRLPLTRALAIAAVASAALMYGMPIVTPLVTRLPGFDVLVLSRFGLVVDFCAVALAARGLETLVSAASGVTVVPAFAAAAGMIALVGASLAFLGPAISRAGRLPATLGWTGWSIALMLAMLVALVMRQRDRIRAQTFGATAAILLCADLVTFAWGFHPTIDRSLVFPAVSQIDAVRQDNGVYRVIGWGDALLPNAASVYGLADPRGYDGIGPRDWIRTLEPSMGADTAYQRLTGPAAFPMLDLLNVKYVIGEPGVELPSPHFARIVDERSASVWRNEQAFPRAFLADRFQVLPSAEAVRTVLSQGTVDLRRTALIETPPLPGLPADTQEFGGSGPGSAIVRRFDDTLVEIDTTTEAPRILMMSDSFFPGWSATVDGMRSALLRADGALRATVVPAGHHIVRFEYRPVSITAGFSITFATALFLVTGIAYEVSRARSHANTDRRTTAGGNR